MKRHESLVSLSKEHYDGLKAARLLKKDTPTYKGLPNSPEEKIIYIINFYNSSLARHFEAEENILFPLITGFDPEIDKLTKNLINEHKLLKNYLNLLDKSVDLIEILNEIGVSLEKHIRREERELFEKIQGKVPDDILEKIKNKLEDFHLNKII